MVRISWGVLLRILVRIWRRLFRMRMVVMSWGLWRLGDRLR